MKGIFDRLRSGELVQLNDPEFFKVDEVVNRTLALMPALNAATTVDEVRGKLSEIMGTELDRSTTIFAPFYTNFARSVNIGKQVFISHACSFLDMGGIKLEDHVLIGPKVNLITENHPLDPTERRAVAFYMCDMGAVTRNELNHSQTYPPRRLFSLPPYLFQLKRFDVMLLALEGEYFPKKQVAVLNGSSTFSSLKTDSEM